MKRLLLLLGLFCPATASAVGIVPPIVRIVKDEPPADTQAGEDDPLKTIERITKNARAVGDRLQNEDAGTDTQKVQDQLLKDIDSLLKPPPPMNNSSGSGGSPPPPMGGGNPPPMGGNPPPMGSGGGSGDMKEPPMGGSGGGSSKRPRGDRKEEQGGGQQQPQPMGGNKPEKQDMGMGGGNDPKQPPMDTGGTGEKNGQGGAGLGGNKSTPNLPLEDPFTRRVWGHLPEKVRQQAMQSYREQFMPRYSEMLKQYYSTLNEKQSPNPSK